MPKGMTYKCYFCGRVVVLDRTLEELGEDPTPPCPFAECRKPLKRMWSLGDAPNIKGETTPKI